MLTTPLRGRRLLAGLFNDIRSMAAASFRDGLASNVAALYALQFANYVIPLLVVPHLLQTLGAAGYGDLAFAQGFIGYLTIVVDYGFDLSATRRIASCRDEPSTVRALSYSVWGAKVALAAAGFVAVPLVCWLLGLSSIQKSYFYVLYATVIGNALFPVWLYQGMERMALIPMISITCRGAALVALLLLVKGPEDGFLAAAVLGLTGAIAGFVAALAALRMFRLGWPVLSPQSIKTVLVEGWTLFLARAAVSLYTAGNAFLLGLVSTPTQVGLFSAAEKIVRGVLGLLSPISQVAYPRLSFLARRSGKAAWRQARVLLCLMGLSGGAFTVALLVGSNLIANFLTSAEAEALGVVLSVLAPIVLLIALSNVLGVQILLPFGEDRSFLRILAGAAVLNVTIGLMLGARWGAVGMAAAVLGAECFVTSAMGVEAGRLLRSHGKLEEEWAATES